MGEVRKENKHKIIITAIIILGFFIRIIGIQDFPNALNVDEASAGYEGYSILNYGIDRNGNFLPCFLQAWGSGQNSLLIYLMIPFIKVIGLNILSIRLPMAILGGISLIIFYLLLKKISNKKMATIGLIFLAICPWHIMKSRWGLESNLFPEMILIFTYLLIKGLIDKNKYAYYSSFIFAGLAAYTYGTSYFFLPVLIIPLLLILIRKKEITIKQSIISILITGIIALPMVIFLIINTFNFEQINLPFLTIPKLEVNRYQEITSIFSADFLTTSVSNFINSIKILIIQSDELPWNSIPEIGTIYIFSSVFTVIGIIECFNKKRTTKIKYNFIFNLWFIVSVILTFICEPNINRLNIIMFPIIYYTVIGIYKIIENRKILCLLITILYVISFMTFIILYVNQDFDKYDTFEGDLKNVTEYVSKLDNKQIYITSQIKEPYIYVLFYSKYDTRKFVNTVEYYDKDVEFRQVKKFGNYNFTDIKILDDNIDNVYVVLQQELENYDFNSENFKITQFDKFVILETIK